MKRKRAFDIMKSFEVSTDENRALSKKPVVVVTGASAGVGRATVRAFAARGAKIGLIARGTEGLEAAKKEIEILGGEAIVLPLDVSSADAVEEAASTVESHFGPIDVWVNNAMLSVFSTVSEMRPEEYKRVTEVSYLGYVYGTLSALKRMKARDKGVIVQVGSALAYRSIPLQSAYCAAKHAINGFTDSLRCELLHDKSKVALTAVHLPAINTTQFSWVKSRLPRKAQPVPPIFQPEVAARAIVWAAFHPQREFWLGYPTWEAVLAERLSPSFADWYLSKTCYEAQMTNEPVDPSRPDNLWAPVPGDAGSHGTFDKQARLSSWQWWIERHKKKLKWTAAGAAILLGLYSLRKRSLPGPQLS